MTGPEHYQAAENCLNATSRYDADSASLLAEAQVHATLALAAATALSQAVRPRIPDLSDWAKVAGAPTREKGSAV